MGPSRFEVSQSSYRYQLISSFDRAPTRAWQQAVDLLQRRGLKGMDCLNKEQLYGS